MLVQIDAEILIRQIQQDIRMKDLESLREHFDQFCEKYEHQTIFSQIYIKFMFSNLLKEIYDNLERKDERELDREIDALYHSSNMAGVIKRSVWVLTGSKRSSAQTAVLRNAEKSSRLNSISVRTILTVAWVLTSLRARLA